MVIGIAPSGTSASPRTVKTRTTFLFARRPRRSPVAREREAHPRLLRERCEERAVRRASRSCRTWSSGPMEATTTRRPSGVTRANGYGRTAVCGPVGVRVRPFGSWISPDGRGPGDGLAGAEGESEESGGAEEPKTGRHHRPRTAYATGSRGLRSRAIRSGARRRRDRRVRGGGRPAGRRTSRGPRSARTCRRCGDRPCGRARRGRGPSRLRAGRTASRGRPSSRAPCRRRGSASARRKRSFPQSLEPRACDGGDGEEGEIRSGRLAGERREGAVVLLGFVAEDENGLRLKEGRGVRPAAAASAARRGRGRAARGGERRPTPLSSAVTSRTTRTPSALRTRLGIHGSRVLRAHRGRVHELHLHVLERHHPGQRHAGRERVRRDLRVRVRGTRGAGRSCRRWAARAAPWPAPSCRTCPGSRGARPACGCADRLPPRAWRAAS